MGRHSAQESDATVLHRSSVAHHMCNPVEKVLRISGDTTAHPITGYSTTLFRRCAHYESCVHLSYTTVNGSQYRPVFGIKSQTLSVLELCRCYHHLIRADLHWSPLYCCCGPTLFSLDSRSGHTFSQISGHRSFALQSTGCEVDPHHHGRSTPHVPLTYFPMREHGLSFTFSSLSDRSCVWGRHTYIPK